MDNIMFFSKNQLHNKLPICIDGKNRNENVFLCDFDGTISVKDVTDTLLKNFAHHDYLDLEDAWLSGQIGSQECMSKQIALLDVSKSELDECLSDIEIDPTFKQFIKKTTQLGIPVQIVSDGLDYAISHILKKNGLSGLPIFANHLVQTDDKKWQLDFPYANKTCKKRSGNCKCAHVSSVRNQFDNILYVGDGSSDFCVSHVVDMVFAKDKLIKYCEEKQIDFYPITAFSQISTLLHELQVQDDSIGINDFSYA